MNFNDNDGDLYVKTKDEKKLLTILCNEIWKKKFIEYLFLSFIHKKKLAMTPTFYQESIISYKLLHE